VGVVHAVPVELGPQVVQASCAGGGPPLRHAQVLLPEAVAGGAGVGGAHAAGGTRGRG